MLIKKPLEMDEVKEPHKEKNLSMALPVYWADAIQKELNMPGYDRTGPRGLGPGTGGRRGLCFSSTGPSAEGFYGRGLGRGGAPWGGGRGRCFGGRGAGWGYGPVYPMNASQESEMLRNELDLAKRQVEAMENRLADLEKADKE